MTRKLKWYSRSRAPGSTCHSSSYHPELGRCVAGPRSWEFAKPTRKVTFYFSHPSYSTAHYLNDEITGSGPVQLLFRKKMFCCDVLRYLRTLNIDWSWWDADLHHVSLGSKLYTTFLNITQHFKTTRHGCGLVPVILSIKLCSVLLPNHGICHRIRQFLQGCVAFLKTVFCQSSNCVLSSLAHTMLGVKTYSPVSER